jgi:hypothetical protein
MHSHTVHSSISSSSNSHRQPVRPSPWHVVYAQLDSLFPLWSAPKSGRATCPAASPYTDVHTLPRCLALTPMYLISAFLASASISLPRLGNTCLATCRLPSRPDQTLPVPTKAYRWPAPAAANSCARHGAAGVHRLPTVLRNTSVASLVQHAAPQQRTAGYNRSTAELATASLRSMHGHAAAPLH